LGKRYSTWKRSEGQYFIWLSLYSLGKRNLTWKRTEGQYFIWLSLYSLGKRYSTWKRTEGQYFKYNKTISGRKWILKQKITIYHASTTYFFISEK
jgi:hypothetical protein